MAKNLFYLYSLGLTFFYDIICFEHMQLKNQVLILKEKTVQVNSSAEQVRENGLLLSYFAVAAWTSSFILYFYNVLDVSSPIIELI